jgi:dGTPase
LVETICLAHDLGHAPFGHAGEDSLDALMREHGGFNHNAQSFRVVTSLEERYPGWTGLNLTVEALEGIAKHEAAKDLSGLMGLDPRSRGSLEAQIANTVDELAYSAHDLDDGLLSGLIVPSQLEALEIWQMLCERLGWRGAVLDDVTRHHLIRELVGLLVDDLLTTTAARIEAAGPTDPRQVTQHADNLVRFSEPVWVMTRKLKKFLYANMYFHPTVIGMARRADHIIRGLFNSYAEEPRQLPRPWQARIEREGKARTIADYIACLTDRSATTEYQRMYAR